MGKVYYNKLVRDRIPEIIRVSGKTCETRILDEQEYREKLIEKLSEEVREFGESFAPEELADIMEVVEALAAVEGIDSEQLRQMKEAKRARSGGFLSRVQLILVEDH